MTAAVSAGAEAAAKSNILNNQAAIEGMETNSGRQSLELKVPPGILVIIMGLGMWVAGALVPALTVRWPMQSTVAWGLGLFGLLVAALGFGEFQRARTTVNPTKPEAASALVTQGIYQRTRNPMYLGFLLILLGWAAGLGSLLALGFLPGFVVYMNRFQIKPEERILAGIFGEEFQRYCAQVRRWI